MRDFLAKWLVHITLLFSRSLFNVACEGGALIVGPRPAGRAGLASFKIGWGRRCASHGKRPDTNT